jgi:enamine deaminase RidA (YjgF/YER057c/UK114 family)
MRRETKGEEHWRWATPAPFAHGARAGSLVVVGGQADLDTRGRVTRPGDLRGQLAATVQHLQRVLGELGADLADLVKVVAFYAASGPSDDARASEEPGLVEALRASLPGDPPPALMPVPLASLPYEGLRVVLEGIAVREPDGRRVARRRGSPGGHWPWPFSHALRAGDLVFVGAQMPLDASGRLTAPGDPVGQAHANLDHLRHALASVDATMEDVCRINTFYVGHGTTEDWARAGRIRGNAFAWPGPCGTGVPLPREIRPGLTIRQEAVAVSRADGRPRVRQPVRPPGHWDWPVPVTAQQGVRAGRLVFVGGQVSADERGRVVHPGDLAAQARAALHFVRQVLASSGAGPGDLVKVNAFYRGGTDPAPFHQLLRIMAEEGVTAGAAVTAVPLEKLGLEGMEVEIEGWAVAPEPGRPGAIR